MNGCYSTCDVPLGASSAPLRRERRIENSPAGRPIISSLLHPVMVRVWALQKVIVPCRSVISATSWTPSNRSRNLRSDSRKACSASFREVTSLSLRWTPICRPFRRRWARSRGYPFDRAIFGDKPHSLSR